MTSFNPSLEKSKLAGLRNNVQVLSKKLAEGERINKQLESLMDKYTRAREAQENLELMLKVLNLLLKEVQQEDISFKNRRLNYLADKVSEVLRMYFPEDGFYAKTVVEPSRGVRSRLALFDRYDRERDVVVGEGDHLQSQINLAASLAVLDTLNVKNLNIDEAFAATSLENLSTVQEIIKDYVDKGVQIVLISQREEAYVNLPRTEIHVRRDSVKNASQVVDIKVY